MKLCDLHTHSVYSDGSATPAEIISEAKRLGLGAVALTDHNTTAGLPEFLAEGEKQGVTAVPGIELSTNYGGRELHLLGLFVQPEHCGKLDALTEGFHRLKEESNLRLAEGLRAAGYGIDYARVKKRNPSGNVNRVHFAEELLERGFVSSVKEAFETILDEKCGLYVPPERLGLLDAIRFLSELRILPILAHPLQELDEGELRALLPAAIGAGLLGLETLHSSYGAGEKKIALGVADEFGLAKSGGSDYHGSGKPDVRLAFGRGELVIPVQIYEDLLQLVRAQSLY